MTIRPFKTGACRGQSSLLPPRIEDYVGPDNPVRVIEAYVSMLDLAALGSATPIGTAARASRRMIRPTC
jgi:hypothetical protein